MQGKREIQLSDIEGQILLVFANNTHGGDF